MTFKKYKLDQIDDSRSLTEDFENLPEWIVSKIRSNKVIKNKLTDKGVNLETAMVREIPPGNLTRSDLEDSSKVWFIAIQHRSNSGVSKYYDLYIPGVSGGDDSIQIDSRWRTVSKLGVKTLSELASHVAYVDLNDPANNMRGLRQERKNAAYARRDVDRDTARRNAQYPKKINIQYGLTPRGTRDYDTILSYDIEWLTKKGYDKSGYPIDPDKYVKILNNVGLNNYSIRLERMYSQIESLRTELANLMLQFNSEDSSKYRTSGFSRSIFDDIGSAIRDFASIITEYQRLKHDVEAIISRWKDKTQVSEEELDEEIRWTFRHNGSNVSSSIKDLRDTIRRLKNPIPLETE